MCAYAKLKCAIYAWTNVLVAVQLLQSLRAVSGRDTNDVIICLIHGSHVSSVLQKTCVWHFWGWSWISECIFLLLLSHMILPLSPHTRSHQLRDHIALCQPKHTLVVIRSHLNKWTTKNSCKPCCCELLLHVHLHVMCGWNRQAWELALNDLQQLKVINTQLTDLGRKMRRYVRRCVLRRWLSCVKLMQILPLAWSPPTNVNPLQVCAWVEWWECALTNLLSPAGLG